MAFQFDPEIVKKHPAAFGAIVLIGGVIVFFFLSRRGSVPAQSAGSNASASGDFQASLAAQSQIAQTNAAAGVQNYQTTAALQSQQLQAQTAAQQLAAQTSTSNFGTAAALVSTLAQTQAQVAINSQNTNATTTQLADQLVYAQNLQEMQDTVLQNNISAGVAENANNNATALASEGIGAQVSDIQANLQYNLSQSALADTAAANATAQQQYGSTLDFVYKNANVTTGSGEYGLEQSLIGTNPANPNASAVTAITQAQTQGAAAINASNNSLYASITKSAAGLASTAIGAFA